MAGPYPKKPVSPPNLPTILGRCATRRSSSNCSSDEQELLVAVVHLLDGGLVVRLPRPGLADDLPQVFSREDMRFVTSSIRTRKRTQSFSLGSSSARATAPELSVRSCSTVEALMASGPQWWLSQQASGEISSPVQPPLNSTTASFIEAC